MSISSMKGNSARDAGFFVSCSLYFIWELHASKCLNFYIIVEGKERLLFSQWKIPSIFQLKFNYKVQRDANIEDWYQVLLSLNICSWLQFPENHKTKVQIFSKELRQHLRLHR